MSADKKFLTIDGRKVAIQNDRNLLELIRRSGIDLPTFCYHSDLSVYGACRLCVVDIEGMGIVASCSTEPREGMVVRTNTGELREMRQIYLKLLLADHHKSCTTCSKSGSCRLQELAFRLGVTDVPFKTDCEPKPIDCSSPSLIRDPNKCVLCGDCVRACEEIQGVGAIDFVSRGSNTLVAPAFLKDLSEVECVYCGLCASVCPTGAITPKPEIKKVWNAINDPTKKVVAQIAPAVRVALGEMFGLEAGVLTIGKIVAALKMLQFDAVYDTSFAADLTILEETNEFIAKKTAGQKLPLFTSCCPAWVKYAEQFCPDLLGQVSSCKSPQQMFGSVAKDTLPAEFGVEAKDLFVVSIMPCTAKKFEAQRPEFANDGVRDVDAVLTTQELGKMIQEAGIQFNELTPESLDLPLGFKTGAGVIFGATGGVSEAVLRYASEKLTGEKLKSVDFHEVRGPEGVKVFQTQIAGISLKLAVVHGLKNAEKIIEDVRQGKSEYDFVEVMACPGGCIAGAGQPVSWDKDAKAKRTQGLYDNDKRLQLHKSQDNPYVSMCYEKNLGEIGGHKAHELLHTEYQSRRRIGGLNINLTENECENKLVVSVCVGTCCHIKGSGDILHQLVEYVGNKGLDQKVNVEATFCFENCDRGPNVKVGGQILNGCTFETVASKIDELLS